MTGDDAESTAPVLRELARWVVRDGVDGEHLES